MIESFNDTSSMNKNSTKMPAMAPVTETRSLGVALEPGIDALLSTKRQTALNNIGIDKDYLIGRAVRHAVNHGTDYRNIEADVFEEVSELAEVYLDAYAEDSRDSIIDKAVSATIDQMLPIIDRLSTNQAICDFRTKTQTTDQHKETEWDIADLKNIQDTDAYVATLQTEEIIGYRSLDEITTSI